MSIFSFIKSQVSIFDVVSEYAHLKRSGAYWKCKCPFHLEADASFTVNIEKQIFYCFGCHEHGDTISFIAKTEKLSQYDAALYLVDKCNLNVPEDISKSLNLSKSSISEKDIHFKVYTITANWAYKMLLQHKSALDYTADRGIRNNTLKQFQIGYFPSIKSSNFINYALKQNILIKDLLECGIVVEDNNSFYSPWDDRILFPIHDAHGNICGFGGRVFKENDTRVKYLNSKESVFFIKGKLLFGLNFAKKSMQEKQFVFLVEGYMDCLLMVQHGYINSVATLGTSCTPEQLIMISKHAKTVYVVYDGDRAGQNAVIRLAEMCFNADLDINVVILDKNEDPASMLSTNKNLDVFIDKAKNIFSFFVDTISDDFANKSLAEKITLSNRITSLISNVKGILKQELLLKQAVKSIDISYEILRNIVDQKYKMQFNKNIAKDLPLYLDDNKNESNIDNKSEIDKTLNSIEERILFVIINTSNIEFESVLTLNDDNYRHFSVQFKNIFKKLMSITNYNKKNCWNIFFSQLNENERKLIIKVDFDFNDCINASKESLQQLLATFCKVNWKKVLKKFKEDILDAVKNEDCKKKGVIMNNFSELKNKMQRKGLI